MESLAREEIILDFAQRLNDITRMTKNKELEILRRTASELGADSYTGPWLESILPDLESVMRSDFLPTLTVQEAILAADKAATEILDAAQSRAKQILTAAKNNADVMEKAWERARKNTLEALRESIRNLENV